MPTESEMSPSTQRRAAFIRRVIDKHRLSAGVGGPPAGRIKELIEAGDAEGCQKYLNEVFRTELLTCNSGDVVDWCAWAFTERLHDIVIGAILEHKLKQMRVKPPVEPGDEWKQGGES